mgnify:CR=1 FL=1
MRLPSRDPGSQPTQSLSQGAQGTPPAGARPHRHAASSGDLPGSNEPTTSIPAEELEEWREEWQDDDEGFPSSGDRTTVVPAPGPATQAYPSPDPTTAFPAGTSPTTALPAGDYDEGFPSSGDRTTVVPAPGPATQAYPSPDPTTAFPAGTSPTTALPAGDYDEGFPSSGDRTTVMSTPDPTTVFPSRGAPAGGGPVRTPIMPDHRAQAGARSPAGTWSQAAPPPARWGEPVESPLPPAVPRPQTGTQSSAGRWSQAAQPASQSPSWRAPQPTPRPQEAYQPAARPQAEPQPAPWGGPVESPRPVLPPPPARRHTAALPLGTLMLVVTIGLLGWGTYTFLTSLHILDLVQGTVDKTIWTAGGAVIGGAVLAFFTVIVSFVAVARAKPKTAALTLMLGAFFLPLGACAAGVHYGWPVLKENTLAEARQMAGTVNPDDVDALIGQVEDLGINVPWRGELMEILRGESQ